jgi:hypothetical protein
MSLADGVGERMRRGIGIIVAIGDLHGPARMPQRALEIVHEQGSPRELGKDARLESHVASHLEQRALRGAEPGRRLHALAREHGEPPQRVGPLAPLGEPIG